MFSVRCYEITGQVTELVEHAPPKFVRLRSIRSQVIPRL